MFGPHVGRIFAKKPGRPSLADHIQAAREMALGYDFVARAFQVFVANPRSLSLTLKDYEADDLRKYLDAHPRLAVIAHGTHMDAPWSGNKYIAKFIRKELTLCARAGIRGLVIHLGKTPVEVVVEYLPRLMTPVPTARVYLETPAVKPETARYETPEKLARLFKAIRGVDPPLDRFGLCIDTAHLWSCGVDIRSYEAAADWIGRLEKVADIIPADRIILHLNDNYNKLGGGRDIHAPLLQGDMWGAYADRPRDSGLAAFVEYAVRNSTPVILERGVKKTMVWLADDYQVLWDLTDTVRA